MKTLLISLFLIATQALAQATFSPAPGTYPGTVTVTINCPSGDSCYYTTDGSTPNIASALYSSPLTLTSTSTLNVISVQTGVSIQNPGTSSAHWKCTTATAHTYGPPPLNCETGGGVGSVIPSAVSWTFGTPMVETVSTTQSSGETQILFINGQSSAACPNCTMLAEDKVVQASQGPSFVANQEMDATNNNLATWNQWHTASLQCNQQAGNPIGSGTVKGMQWQYDNQQGSWLNFNPSITYGCPLSTTQQTEIRYTIHWTNGDKSCGGFSTDHYDALTVCVGGSNGTGGICHDYVINKTLCGYSEPTFTQELGIQDQHDLTNTTQSGQNPTTAARSVWRDNVSIGYFGTTKTATATYTIGAGSPPTVIIKGATTFSGQVISIQ
jgi:hypothetical protein